MSRTVYVVLSVLDGWGTVSGTVTQSVPAATILCVLGREGAIQTHRAAVSHDELAEWGIRQTTVTFICHKSALYTFSVLNIHIAICSTHSEVLQRAASVSFSCQRPEETFLAWHGRLAIKMSAETSSEPLLFFSSSYRQELFLLLQRQKAFPLHTN